MARLAARGLPPDWTEEDLRRQGHDLDATREEDGSSSEEDEGEDGSGYPGETEDRGDGRGVAAQHYCFRDLGPSGISERRSGGAKRRP